ncbi:hypothetical protein ACFQS7_15920 [Dankookia sp. GCM10030260]|uniref:hypothetical protein n=1 Tax=Dankookia sp. GCM10030260 TaxID=3273390 RepID=UPI00360D62FE
MSLASGRHAARAALLALALLLPAQGSRADALADLDQAFKATYRQAATQTLDRLRASVPVLVNRFEQLALYRPGIAQPELFAMDTGLYLQASAVSHTAAALDARLLAGGLGRLDAEALAWLARYASLLAAAEAEIAGRQDMPEALRVVQRDMLAEVRRFTQRIQQQGAVDQAMLDALGAAVRPAIQRNLTAAAVSQLDQFRAQLARWQAAYPGLAWDRALAVVIGVHQARDGNLQRQFFDRMLGDRPDRQDRVVFAETLAPPAPLDQAPPTEALMLLAKVVLDKGLAASLFGDPLALQSDVLGPAAAAAIAGWR